MLSLNSCRNRQIDWSRKLICILLTACFLTNLSNIKKINPLFLIRAKKLSFLQRCWPQLFHGLSMPHSLTPTLLDFLSWPFYFLQFLRWKLRKLIFVMNRWFEALEFDTNLMTQQMCLFVTAPATRCIIFLWNFLNIDFLESVCVGTK
jgi:hypothetical protein